MRVGERWRWVVAGAVLVATPLLMAADHRDGATVKAEPAADLTDLYAWMSSDVSRVNLILNVFPDAGTAAAFSDTVQYVFHVNSRQDFVSTTGTDTDVICTFAEDQTVSCWAGDEFATGDASFEDGISSAGGELRVFAGRRNDPFFFNLDGFNATREAIAAAAPSLTNDANGCPTLDPTTASTLAEQLSNDADGSDGTDDFAGQNVLSLVISVDKAVVTPGGPVLSVWASTRRAP